MATSTGALAAGTATRMLIVPGNAAQRLSHKATAEDEPPF
jgi:hypothetical protein